MCRVWCDWCGVRAEFEMQARGCRARGGSSGAGGGTNTKRRPSLTLPALPCPPVPSKAKHTHHDAEREAARLLAEDREDDQHRHRHGQAVRREPEQHAADARERLDDPERPQAPAHAPALRDEVRDEAARGAREEVHHAEERAEHAGDDDVEVELVKPVCLLGWGVVLAFARGGSSVSGKGWWLCDECRSSSCSSFSPLCLPLCPPQPPHQHNNNATLPHNSTQSLTCTARSRCRRSARRRSSSRTRAPSPTCGS